MSAHALHFRREHRPEPLPSEPLDLAAYLDPAFAKELLLPESTQPFLGTGRTVSGL